VAQKKDIEKQRTLETKIVFSRCINNFGCSKIQIIVACRRASERNQELHQLLSLLKVHAF